MEFKYHIGYKTTNLINDKYYYGIHSTNAEPGTDHYIGSGTALQSAIKKYGRHNFKCEVLKIFKTRTEASEWEREILTEETINSPNCYNLKSGGDSRELEGTGYFSQETLERMSKSHKGVPLGPERARKAVETRRKNGTLKISEEERRRRSLRMLGIKHSPESIRKGIETRRKNGWASSRPEVKLKNSLAHKGKPGTCTGKIHIWKGECERVIKPELWPEFEQQGWNKGRRSSTYLKISLSEKGKISSLRGVPRSEETKAKIRAAKESPNYRQKSKVGYKTLIKSNQIKIFPPEQIEQALQDGWTYLRPSREYIKPDLIKKFMSEVGNHPIPPKEGQMKGKCLFEKDGVKHFFSQQDFKSIIEDGWTPINPKSIFWW